jgi:GDSL-like Lipase/Acylhydrolase family
MDHDPNMTRHMLVVVVILLSGLVPERLAGLRASSLRDSLQSNLFNRADLERMEQGYYEALFEGSRRLDDLAELPAMRVRWRSGSTWSIPVDQSPLVVRVGDLREVVLKKNDATTRFGLDWRTNSQGMRDREYSLEKPPGTVRIALVGDSIGAGWGVNAEDRFESILEELWNRRARAGTRRNVEIINCAVPGHAPGQRWYHFGLVGWPMKPDIVIYEATAADIGWDERRLRFLLARGIGWDCPIYRAALEDAGVQPLGSPDQYKRELKPRHWEILSGAYRFMAADCRARGVPIFWVLVPRIGRRGDADGKHALIETARSAGFSGIIDLTDAFDDLDPASLAVDRDDFHPNALGHARLARRLDQALKPIPEVARIWDRSAGSEGAHWLARNRESHPEPLDEGVKATSFAPTDGGRPR